MAERDELIAKAKAVQERRALLERAKQIQAQRQAPAPKEEVTRSEEAMSTVGKGLDATLRGLGYLAGVTRTAAAAPFLKEVTAQDVLDAINVNKPPAMSGSEILSKAGAGQWGALSDAIPSAFSETGEGIKLQRGGPLDITGRGAAGFALETGLDPLTYVTLGNSALVKSLGKASGKFLPAVEKGVEKFQNLAQKVPVPKALTSPIQTAAQNVGKGVYSWGFKNIDPNLEYLDRQLLSDLMRERGAFGVMGNAKKLRSEAKALGEEAGKVMGEVTDTAAYYGGKVPVSDVSQDALQIARKLRQSGVKEVSSVADDIESRVLGLTEKYGKEIPAHEAQALYTDLGKVINWSDVGKKQENIANYVLQRGVGQGKDKAILETVPELVPKYEAAKKAVAATATADKDMIKAVKSELRKPMVSQVSGMLGAAGALDPRFAAMLAGKEGMRFLNMPLGSTLVGNTLYRGVATPADLLLRRRSVWEELIDEEKKKNGNK